VRFRAKVWALSSSRRVAIGPRLSRSRAGEIPGAGGGLVSLGTHWGGRRDVVSRSAHSAPHRSRSASPRRHYYAAPRCVRKRPGGGGRRGIRTMPSRAPLSAACGTASAMSILTSGRRPLRCGPVRLHTAQGRADGRHSRGRRRTPKGRTAEAGSPGIHRRHYAADACAAAPA
jgi:hypothetical protein